MGLKGHLACAAAIAVLAGEAAAEPASADPSFRALGAFDARISPIADFTAAGALFSVSTRGRRAAIDSYESFENLEDCRAMRGFMPGFPQPANVTVDLRIWF